MKLKDCSKLISGSTNQTASSSLHEPVFSLGAAKWRNTETSLVSFESISLRMADLYLEIEQEIVLRLFEFFKTVRQGCRTEFINMWAPHRTCCSQNWTSLEKSLGMLHVL